VSVIPSYPWPHCASGKTCTMGDPGDGRCRCACGPCRAARWGVSRSGIYRPRWQWWMPWGVTDFWKPRVFRGADEWCHVSFCVVAPPLGCLVLFWQPGRRRTVPCPEDWGLMDDRLRAGYAPCGRYHGGRVNWDAHDHLDGACEEAERWLDETGSGLLPSRDGMSL